MKPLLLRYLLLVSLCAWCTTTWAQGLVVTAPLSNTQDIGIALQVVIEPLAGTSFYNIAWAKAGGSFTKSTVVYPSENQTGPVVATLCGVLDPNTAYDLRVRAYNGDGDPGVPTYVRNIKRNAVATTDAPRILFPTVENPLVSTKPTIEVAAYQGCKPLQAFIEVDKQGEFQEGSLNYQRWNFPAGNVGPYKWTIPVDLLPNTTYVLRVTFVTDPPSGNGVTEMTFITKSVLPVTYLTFPNNGSYLNSFSQTLKVLQIEGATEYELELSTENNFDQPGYKPNFTIRSATNFFTFNATAPGLVSGEMYYVRAKARNATGESKWTSGTSIKSIYNSLHPTSLLRPGGPGFTTGIPSGFPGTKAIGYHVKHADGLFFQISDKPDFSSPPIPSLGAPATQIGFESPYDVYEDGRKKIYLDPSDKTTQVYPSYYARAWVNNGFVNIPDPDNYLSGGPQWVYDYVHYMKPGKTYYIRVKAFRRDPANPTLFAQAGYWYGYESFTTTGTPEARLAAKEAVAMDAVTSNAFHPNPFTEETELPLDPQAKQVRIQVRNTVGQVVEERTVTGESSVRLGKNWSKGLYLIQVSDGKTTQVNRVVKQ